MAKGRLHIPPSQIVDISQLRLQDSGELIESVQLTVNPAQAISTTTRVLKDHRDNLNSILRALQQVDAQTKSIAQAITAPATYKRTLLVKVSTAGDNIADVTTIFTPGYFFRVVGILRIPITSDLSIKIRNIPATGDPPYDLITCTIPLATLIDTPVVFTLPTNTSAPYFNLDDAILWDILTSDDQSDANGVASFTLQWNTTLDLPTTA